MLIKCSCTPLPLHITSPVLGLCVNWFCRSRIPLMKPSTYGPAVFQHKTKGTSHLSTKHMKSTTKENKIRENMWSAIFTWISPWYKNLPTTKKLPAQHHPSNPFNRAPRLNVKDRNRGRDAGSKQKIVRAVHTWEFVRGPPEPLGWWGWVDAPLPLGV